jgi:hypothetical protein
MTTKTMTTTTTTKKTTTKTTADHNKNNGQRQQSTKQFRNKWPEELVEQTLREVAIEMNNKANGKSEMSNGEH